MTADPADPFREPPLTTHPVSASGAARPATSGSVRRRIPAGYPAGAERKRLATGGRRRPRAHQGAAARRYGSRSRHRRPQHHGPRAAERSDYRGRTDEPIHDPCASSAVMTVEPPSTRTDSVPATSTNDWRHRSTHRARPPRVALLHRDRRGPSRRSVDLPASPSPDHPGSVGRCERPRPHLPRMASRSTAGPCRRSRRPEARPHVLIIPDSPLPTRPARAVQPLLA